MANASPFNSKCHLANKSDRSSMYAVTVLGWNPASTHANRTASKDEGIAVVVVESKRERERV
jgi:hypothetical protein